jgi:hypothetical protein
VGGCAQKWFVIPEMEKWFVIPEIAMGDTPNAISGITNHF